MTRYRASIPSILTGTAFATVAIPGAPALAQTVEAQLSVRVAVVSTCTISTDAAGTRAIAPASVACTNGAQWTVTDQPGLRAAPQSPTRYLVTASNPARPSARIRVITITY